MVAPNAVEQVAIKTAAGRLWFGFPHWVVLGWAVLLSWQVYLLRTELDHIVSTRDIMLADNAKTLTALSNAVSELQRSTRVLREDSIKTRTILELKFPKTAGMVDDALVDEQP